MRTIPCLLLVILAASCDPASVCSSGQSWTGGNEGSVLMNPGETCVACHTSSGEGAIYVVAGTVFSDYLDQDRCYGTSGLQVEITDKDGTVFTADTNQAGNFYLTSNSAPGFTMPYTAKVLDGQNVIEMTSSVSDPDCNACHTSDGLNGAPGRIVAPGTPLPQ